MLCRINLNRFCLRSELWLREQNLCHTRNFNDDHNAFKDSNVFYGDAVIKEIQKTAALSIGLLHPIDYYFRNHCLYPCHGKWQSKTRRSTKLGWVNIFNFFAYLFDNYDRINAGINLDLLRM